MRNWWYLLFGLPVAFYIAILFGPFSVVMAVKVLPGDGRDRACTYFTGVRFLTIRERHFCDRLHILVRTDHVIAY